MKTKSLIAPFCLALLLASCAKEKPSTVGQPNTQGVSQNESAGQNRETVELLSQDALRAFLPTVAGLQAIDDGRSSADGVINEASRVYHVSASTGEDITMSIADLGNTENGRQRFFMGKGIKLDNNMGYSGLSVNVKEGAKTTNKIIIIPISTGRYAMDFAVGNEGWGPNGLNDAVVSPTSILRDDYSYIAAYTDDQNPQISGWEIYEGGSRTAMLIIMADDHVGDRFGIILCRNEVDNTGSLKDLARTIDYNALKAL